MNNKLGLSCGWVKVEIKAISAQPTEVGVRLSWAELGNKKNKNPHQNLSEGSPLQT